MSKGILTVTEVQLVNQIINNEGLILLICMSDSSADYQTMLPTIEALHARYLSQLCFYQIDIKSDNDFAKKMDVDVIPTIFLISDKLVIDEREGILSFDEFEIFIENNL